MKFTLKSGTSILLAAVGLLVGNALAAEEALPPEVGALIGKLLPPKVVGREPSRIPNFVYGVSASISNSTSGLGYYEGLANGRWPVILIIRTYQDRTIEILDAKLLPVNFIDWKYVKEERMYVVNRYQFSDSCEASVNDTRIIFGLVKPEKGKTDVSHYSRRVKLAWYIDDESGRISPLSTKGIQCSYFMGDD